MSPQGIDRCLTPHALLHDGCFSDYLTLLEEIDYITVGGGVSTFKIRQTSLQRIYDVQPW